ncbi:hypothetical protein ACFUEM_38660 [Streptomyces anulatus]|uniref:hypothetical protein n=1 Tax=Streptomyces anulatus TaxID=1892 RepID=UPI0035DEC9C3
MAQNPTLPPAILDVLNAVQEVAEKANAAVRAYESAGQDGEPALDGMTYVRTAADLPYAGDADFSDYSAAAFTLGVALNSEPRTTEQWERVRGLADWIGQLARAAAGELAADTSAGSFGTGRPVPAGPTPERIAQIRAEAQSEHRTHAWADAVVEELLTAVERRQDVEVSAGDVGPGDLSHAALIAVLMDAGGSLDLPAGAFDVDALGGRDGSFHALAVEPLPGGRRVRLSVQARPDTDAGGITRTGA